LEQMNVDDVGTKAKDEGRIYPPTKVEYKSVSLKYFTLRC